MWASSPRLTLALTACIAVLLAASQASAHAFLDHAEPKVGSEVDAAPTEIKICFDAAITADSSSIKVLDANGNQVDKQDGHGNAKDKTELIVSLPALAPGTYKVEWRATCSCCAHVTNGYYKFVVKPAK